MSAYNSVFRDDLFQDRNIIVTGGGSGIGRCIAHEIAALGANVIIVGRSEDKLKAVADEIIEDGGKVAWYSTDIRDEDGVASTVSNIIADHGQIHGLVNNAGGQYPSPAETIRKKGFEAVVATNVTGGFLMAREVYTQSMKKHGGGSVVNIVADMWRGMPGMAHSGVARAGMQNLTMTLAVEWAEAGVRMNAVAPGWIASSGFDTYDPSFIKHMFGGMAKNNLARRMGTEAEIASMVTFLLSPGSAFMTGQCIGVDGGAPLYTHLYPVGDNNNGEEYQGFHRYSKPVALQQWEAEQAEKGK